MFNLFLVISTSFIIICLLVYVYFYKKDPDTLTLTLKVTFLSKTEAIHFLKMDSSAQLYFNNIDKRTFQQKVGQSNLDHYYKLIKTFTYSEKQLLKKMVIKLPQQNLLSGNWIFAKTDTHLEMGMPFTLGNVIFISSVTESSEFLTTLVHERIHILQRRYPTKFNQILKILGFRLVTRTGKLPLVVFSNPDGLQLAKSSWIFKSTNKWYCPFLVLRNNKLEKKAIRVIWLNKNKVKLTNDIKTVSNLLSKRFPTCPLDHLYHPYEIMAELGALFVINQSSGNIYIDHFYQQLSTVITPLTI